MTNGRLSIDHQALTRRSGLQLPEHLDMGSWLRIGRQLTLISDASSWWIGDWLVYGQREYAGRYRRAIEETNLDYKTLRNYAWVARKFEMSRRRDKLSLQHHALVAALPEAEQDYWLDLAVNEGWSTATLRQQVNKARRGGVAHQGASIPLALSVQVTSERRRRWEEAAERSGHHLLDWMFTVLDEAADDACGSDEACSSDEACGADDADEPPPGDRRSVLPHARAAVRARQGHRHAPATR